MIDDQISAGFEFNFTLQRALDFVLNVVEIEDRLTARVVLQQARHLRDVFGGKFQQCVIGQARIHADSVELCISEIT
ncbi:hypothetical protein D3C76_1642590 [compost metagenome]